jgi:hypothetical protein
MSQVRRLEYYRHAARFWLKASELQRTALDASIPLGPDSKKFATLRNTVQALALHSLHTASGIFRMRLQTSVLGALLSFWFELKRPKNPCASLLTR